ncbi:MAG: DUF2852 domain-containing protein [Aestuariivirga sp.]
MTYAASASIDQAEGQGAHEAQRTRGCGWGKTRWSALEIGAMVGGFIVFWPLGLLALFLKWKNGEMWKGASDGWAPWSTWKKPDMNQFHQWKQGFQGGYASSGNAAFDDYKREQLKRLEEERRKLEDEQKAFSAYMERLRRAKDQDEFDRFMAERNAPPPAPEAPAA